MIKNSLRVLAVVSALALSLSAGAAYAATSCTTCGFEEIIGCVDSCGESEISFLNDVTGPYSENENELIIEDNFDFEINNDLDANNDLDFDVETGNNEIDYNTIVEDVLTGDIEGSIEFVNEFGLNDFSFDCVGLGDVAVALGNSVTGPYSENENEVNIDSDIDIDIDNDVEFNNDLDFDLNTGKNDITHNTEVGDIRTGDIDVNAAVLNEVSDLSSGVIVPEGVQIEAEFMNSYTGYNSENSNELDFNRSVDIDINNDVEFNNDIDVDANTGKNDIHGNTCVGDISTGDVALDIMVENIVK